MDKVGDKVGTLDPRPWMTARPAAALLAALAGGGRPARFVGGCVRDAACGREVRDIDVATPEPPERATALLERAGIRVAPTGIDHGTVTAIVAGKPFEVTTLRTDLETDGRRARVAFTDDWAADAARRDFTINAMYCDPDGSLYDPTGGLADLRAGRIRFVGDARARIQEDFLRILRFFRFYAWYGGPPPDAGALAACAALAPGLGGLSAERVWAELSRLLRAPDPAGTLALMDAHGVRAHVLPEARRIDRLRALAALERTLGAPPSALRRLAATLDLDADGMRRLARRLRMSRADRERLADLAAHRGALAPGLNAPAFRRQLYRLGTGLAGDLLLLDWAEDGADRSTLWDFARSWRPVEFPLRGADALAVGVAAGPAVGEILERVRGWWIERDFRPDRAACLERLQTEADGGRRPSENAT